MLANLWDKNCFVFSCFSDTQNVALFEYAPEQTSWKIMLRSVDFQQLPTQNRICFGDFKSGWQKVHLEQFVKIVSNSPIMVYK